MSTVDALSVIHEPRIYRIRILREAYSALQQDLPLLAERIYLLRVVVGESIGYVAQSVNIDPDLLPKHCCDLGTALLDRFRHLRERKDLDEAEAYFRLVLRHYPLNPSHVTSNSLLLLGAVLRERAYETKGAQAAAEALAIHRQLYTDYKRPAVSILERAHQARELGWTLNMFHRVNKAEDSVLFESIERLKEAEALFVEAQAADHICLLGLCDVLGFVYVVQPDKAHVEDSISYGERALKTCGPDHRDVFWIARRLAHMRASFAFYYDDLRSLNQGIDLFREALVNAPPRWKIVLSTYLADALQLRYWKQRKEEDLTEILTISSALVTNMTPDDVGWGKLQECLCNMWLVRFQSTGRPEDIEAAAQAAHLAGAAIAVGTVVHAFRLIQLVECRLHQFEAFGDVNHLNECIEILERITQPDAVHSTHWKEAARRLLRAYYLRYKTAGDLTDLDQATVLLPILNSNHDHEEDMNRQYALSIAGHILLARFMVTGTREDLEQATVLHQKALNCEVSYNNHQVVSAFTTTLRVRYETLHEEDSLARAVVLQKATADALPEVHLDRAEVLCGLGWLRLCLHRAEGHIGEALDDLLGALKSVYCPAHSRLKHVWDVLTYLAKEMPEALDHEDAVKLSAVYSTAIDLLPQAASFDLEPRIRLEVIAGAGQLTIQGATHAISIDRLDLALEMLEAGRSVFWTQSLRLRTPFTDLPKTIGNRLSKITYALARPIVEEADRERELLRRRQLGDEFQTVLAEARAVPGFENLLRNASFEALARAARNHPMVVLLTGEASGHAIIIYGDSETHLVPLPQVTAKGLQTLSLRIEAHTKSVRSTDLRGIRRVPAKTQPPDVYRELWTLIMRPIVEALQWRKSVGRDRPRLTLCPTGVFMRLPLHAAGIYTGNDRECCSDYLVASYTPSIGALLHAQQTVQPIRKLEADTLLVAVRHPFQDVALPMVEEEAEVVQQHVSPSSKVIRASNCPDMLKHIQSASIVHLACHGTQNPSDALQSGFYLEDGLLSVSKLMDLDLPRAFLAVLSACETAKGDAAQPDQAIHLAAAMLFAGFKSVIATMWFMGDLEGPVVAESIYSALFDNNNASECLNPDDVPYALDRAVQTFRESGLDPSFWATYVHIGI